jgi:hypothetical protein
MMKINKRQLRRIIREEKDRIVREQDAAVDTRQHHYPSADSAIANVVGELAEGWQDMELKAWSAGDPSMNMQGELSDAESKEAWSTQVNTATDDLEDALKERLRDEAIKVMQEYTDSLINGDYV